MWQSFNALLVFMHKRDILLGMSGIPNKMGILSFLASGAERTLRTLRASMTVLMQRITASALLLVQLVWQRTFQFTRVQSEFLQLLRFCFLFFYSWKLFWKWKTFENRPIFGTCLNINSFSPLSCFSRCCSDFLFLRNTHFTCSLLQKHLIMWNLFLYVVMLK